MCRFGRLGVALTAILVSPNALHSQVPDAARRAASGIQRTELIRHIGVLAADSMLGRATPSRELDRAAAYIAHELSTNRVRPFGDGGSYLQRVRFGVQGTASDCSFAELGGVRFALTNDVRLPPRGDRYAGPTVAHGPLAFVQHGWVSKKLGIDPYAGLDLRGKIAIVTGYPGGGQRLQADRVRGGDFVLPWNAAAERGAVAQLEISGFAAWEVSHDPMPRLRDSLSAGAVTLAAPWLQSATSPIPRLAVSRRLADAIFSGEPRSATELISDAKRGDSTTSFALSPGHDLHFEICTTKVRSDSTANVVAMVEGTDPVLKHEYIVIGAHYDGQGLQLPPVNGDSILNSANDNASGAAGLLAIARTFARGPRPRRSVIFAWFAGEEMGLGVHVGSAFFVAHPPVPLDRIRAMINLDMLAPDKDGSVGLLFSHTALRDLALKTNTAYANARLVAAASGQRRPGGGGSDRDAFRSKQIPFLAIEADGGDDSHEVTDEASRIDFAGLERIVRTAYLIAWRVANERLLQVR